MKCTYLSLNPGSTGHSFNKQAANAQCCIFARSVMIIIFKDEKKKRCYLNGVDDTIY